MPNVCIHHLSTFLISQYLHSQIKLQNSIFLRTDLLSANMECSICYVSKEELVSQRVDDHASVSSAEIMLFRNTYFQFRLLATPLNELMSWISTFICKECKDILDKNICDLEDINYQYS